MEHGTILLETAREDEENRRTLFFARPRRVIAAYEPSAVRVALEELDHWVSRGYYAAGYLEYEAGLAFEEIGPLEPGDRPLVWFGVYREPSKPPPSWLAAADSPVVINPRFSVSKPAYRTQFNAVKQHLHEGDVYQINLTGEFGFEYDGNVVDLYRQLRDRQPVGYNALLITDRLTVLSCSPELFFRREGDRIWVRPMKGTVRRGQNASEDKVLSEWLRDDPKTQAENLMIVDLLRNDLSRIARMGSVTVSDMFEPEHYSTVIQLTTTVSATLNSGSSYAEIFRALFPCGSVTGAPKVRAMQIIRNLEQRQRGVYTGAIGFIAPDRQAVFSVAIRTVSLSGSAGRMGSGGGIVWDSSADAEFRECLLKASFLTGKHAQPDLFETMLWDEGYECLERHLTRLESSAGTLGYHYGADQILSALRKAEDRFSTGPMRIRLLLHPDGHHSVDARPLDRPSIQPGTVTVSGVRTNPDDVWLYHKSTRREVYDAEYASALSKGHVEVIFLNNRNEVTEGSRSNLFIRSGDRLVTPPVVCGLLPGTRRAEILETEEGAAEAVIRMADLRNADEILLCNATTPLTPVVLSEQI